MSVKGDVAARIIPPLVIVGGLGAGAYILYKKGVFAPITNAIDTVVSVPAQIIETVGNKVTTIVDNGGGSGSDPNPWVSPDNSTTEFVTFDNTSKAQEIIDKVTDTSTAGNSNVFSKIASGGKKTGVVKW